MRYSRYSYDNCILSGVHNATYRVCGCHAPIAGHSLAGEEV